MNKRGYCTPPEKLAILERQGYLCSCGCGTKILPVHRVDWEHTLAIGLGGASKPDAAMLHTCHGPKTATDKHMMSKADRIRRKRDGSWYETKGRKNRPKIQSPGFSKRLSKKFNGKVERK